MVEGKKTGIADEDSELAPLCNVMVATGLPVDKITSLWVTDDDLDELCDAVISDLAAPVKKVVKSKR